MKNERKYKHRVDFTTKTCKKCGLVVYIKNDPILCIYPSKRQPKAINRERGV